MLIIKKRVPCFSLAEKLISGKINAYLFWDISYIFCVWSATFKDGVLCPDNENEKVQIRIPLPLVYTIIGPDEDEMRLAVAEIIRDRTIK